MKDLFNNISKKNRRKLLELLEAHIELIKEGSTMPKNVKPKKYVAFVEYGYVQIIKNDYSGNDILIEEWMDGDSFGNIISSITNIDYSIYAVEDTKLYIIDFDNIMKIKTSLSYLKEFKLNIMQLMADKISDNNKRIDILTNKTIRNKLLEYFRIISKKNNSNIIYLPFTYTSLADYLAIDRCAMSREIKNLKNEGLIEVKGKKIKLLYYIK